MNENKKLKYLALCLFEALEDQNYNMLQSLLDRGASPNEFVILKDFAPIHYAAGMEAILFGEQSMELFLRYDGDPNVQSGELLTPLHIACNWGRPKIVEMLLKHNGDLDILDDEQKTPIQYAITEKQYNVILVIQNFLFEQKIARKLENKTAAEVAPTAAASLSVNNRTADLIPINELKYTPNRVHYNFDVTSPYYINITHRRKIEKNGINHQLQSTIIGDDTRDVSSVAKNLFELTENNITEFTKDITEYKSRRSIIDIWRDKVHEPRPLSILSQYETIEEVFSGVNDILRKELEEDAVTSLSGINIIPPSDDDEESFITAQEPPQTISPCETYVIQLTENYVHTDDENGLVFYEKKVLPNSVECRKGTDLNSSHSTVSTVITIPAEYDTDDLRRELTIFGHPPGPITSSTKRLYLKRLIKFKRHPEQAARCESKNSNPNYSVEIMKTLREPTWVESVPEYIQLEKTMIESFSEAHSRRFREGHLKTSFVYLLIDPRISNNLPGQHKSFDKQEMWRTFLASIFYVGKGKSSRPYSHLYDAMKQYQFYKTHYPQPRTICQRKQSRDMTIAQERILFEAAKSDSAYLQLPSNPTIGLKASPIRQFNLHLMKQNTQESKKLERIVDIWNGQKGVVCLHVFHNIIPAEAYTREAAIIECLGLSHLTNLKRGDYYGEAQTWNLRKKKQLGIGLLYRAMNIFVAEGESQLTPNDLV